LLGGSGKRILTLMGTSLDGCRGRLLQVGHLKSSAGGVSQPSGGLPSFSCWRRRAAAIAATGALAVIGAGLVAPTGAEGVTIGGGNSTNLNPLGAPGGLDDVDTRTGTVAPSSTQLSAVSALVPLPGGTGSVRRSR